MRTNPTVRALVGLLLASALSSAPVASQTAPPATIKVGQLTLALCNTDFTGYCGQITRPLDPSGAVPGTLTVGFEYYPRTDAARPRVGTILPQEGGPGYSSTGTRGYYLTIFGPLRDRHDVLIIDKRGTGLSSPIDCPALQTGSLALSAVGECARLLGPSGWFYGTDFAVGDMVAVLDALDIGEVDFYGDSYGTFVGQILAALYPDRLRSIILDSAYPVRPPDVWFATDWAKAWSGIELSCVRSPSCSSLGGTATGRVTQLLNYIRQTPISGLAPDGHGMLQPTTLDTGALLRLIDNSGNGLSIYRDLDAAARAWLDSKDPLPILRMVAELDTAASSAPADFSYGLYTAVLCSDYPMMYDLRASRSVRNSQYAAALAEARMNRPGLFAPFTVDEGVDSKAYITPLDTCLPWRAPPAAQVPGVPLPPALKFPTVPTLVMSGDLDSVTSPEDAAETTAQFPNAVHVVFPNLTHVVTDSDFVGCTESVALNFVRTLTVGDTSCSANIREVRTVPRFVRLASDVLPVTATTGNAASAAQRRIASVAVEVAGDMIARYWASSGTSGAGLRGGTFSYAGTNVGYHWMLDGVRWTEDVAVSGTLDWNMNNNKMAADFAVYQNGARVGTVIVHWNDADVHASATVTGNIQGAVLRGQRVAP